MTVMKKVLVVENDEDTRSIYATVLTHRGYEVLQAADGATGVDLARTHAPDLILMNLSMPKLDGISATSVLRGETQTAAIPIIACTGFISEDGQDAAEDAGVDAYLEKPCVPSRILEEVERFIGPPPAAPAELRPAESAE